MAVHSLLFEASELHCQNGSLPFAQTVVRSIDKMTIEPLFRHASAVVNRAGLAFEVIIVRDDDAAFSGRHQFAGLKTEGSTHTEGANLFATPFAAMRVRRIFDQCEAVLFRDLLQAIHVGRKSSHVHGNDRLGAWCDRRFSYPR